MILYIGLTLVTVLSAYPVCSKLMQERFPACQKRTGSRPPVAQQAAGLTRQQTVNGICLTLIFFLLFSVSAFRTGIGNDYERYEEIIYLVEYDQVVPTEIGFNLLVKFINAISGFINPKMVFAVFAFATILLFLIGMMQQSVDFPLTFFLFMTLGYYFQTMNTVRYYLALAIAFVCMRYVLKGQYVRFVLLVLLGASFHKSLLVVLPLYLLAKMPWKKWMLAFAGVISVSFLLFQDFYLKLVVFLYPSYKDTEYLEGGTSIPNILRCLAVLAFSLIYYKDCVKGHKENQFYFYLNLGACVLYTCCSFLPVISRIGYYLTISHILFLPSLVQSMKKQSGGKRFTDRFSPQFWYTMFFLAGCVYFLLFLRKAEDVAVGLLPYETWLFRL